MYPPAILKLKLKIQLPTDFINVDLEKFSADYVVEHAAQLWSAEDRTALTCSMILSRTKWLITKPTVICLQLMAPAVSPLI